MTLSLLRQKRHGSRHLLDTIASAIFHHNLNKRRKIMQIDINIAMSRGRDESCMGIAWFIVHFVFRPFRLWNVRHIQGISPILFPFLPGL